MESFIYTKNKVLPNEMCETFIRSFQNPNITRPGVVCGKDGIVSDETIKVSTSIAITPEFETDSTWRPLLQKLYPILDNEKNNFYNCNNSNNIIFSISIR